MSPFMGRSQEPSQLNEESLTLLFTLSISLYLRVCVEQACGVAQGSSASGSAQSTLTILTTGGCHSSQTPSKQSFSMSHFKPGNLSNNVLAPGKGGSDISNSVSRHIIRQMKEEAQREIPTTRMQAMPVTTGQSGAKSLCSKGSTDTRPP